MCLTLRLKVRVPEDTSPWKDVLQISAQDADINSKLVFSIHSGLHPLSTKLFHLDPKSGVLVLTEELDYETISVHTLVVMVTTQLSQLNLLRSCVEGHKSVSTIKEYALYLCCSLKFSAKFVLLSENSKP